VPVDFVWVHYLVALLAAYGTLCGVGTYERRITNRTRRYLWPVFFLLDVRPSTTTTGQTGVT